MRLRVISVATLVAGCHATKPVPSIPSPAADVSGIDVQFPLRVQNSAGFVSHRQAIVPAIDTGGHCERVPAIPTPQSGQRALNYTFGTRGSPQRFVMLVIDSAQSPVRYVDRRIGLRGPKSTPVLPANPSDHQTTITLNLRDTSAIIRNLGAHATELHMRGPDALVAPVLGVPATMIATILRECADSR